MRRIIQFRCNRYLRRKQLKQVCLEDALTCAYSEPGPHELAEKKDLEEKVFQAVNSLSQPLREVTTLYYINGYTKTDIAEFLEIPENTVKRRLNASRMRLERSMSSMIKEVFGDKRLSDSFVKRVISGVRRTNDFLDGRIPLTEELNMPQFTTFLTNLCTCLEKIKEDYGITMIHLPFATEKEETVNLRMNNLYMTLMCVSGAAFRLVWNPGKWDYTVYDLMAASTDPQDIISYISDFLGFELIMIGNKDFFNDKPGKWKIFKRYESSNYFKNSMIQSIKSGKPAIAWEYSNECIIHSIRDSRPVITSDYRSFYRGYLPDTTIQAKF